MIGRSGMIPRGNHAFDAHGSNGFSAAARGRRGKAVVGMSAMVLLLLAGTQQASPLSGRLAIDERIDRLESRFNTQLDGWLAHLGDAARAEAIDFEDSTWENADIGYRWETPYSICWFRVD